MKKSFILVGLVASVMCFGTALLLRAQGKPAAKYEYAIVKWDGPDRLYYNLPDKFELIHLDKGGVKIAKDAQEEEFCLAYACNHLAKDGWETVNLNSRRVLFRRALTR
jgi:hypothetical protein